MTFEALITIEVAKTKTVEELAQLSKTTRFRIALLCDLFKPNSKEESVFIGQSADDEARALFEALHPQEERVLH